MPIETTYKKILKQLENNQIPLVIFFSSLFVFLSFAGTRLFITDDGITLNQFYNLLHGSISLEAWKINTDKGVYLLFNDKLYGKFSYSLIILSFPSYYVLKILDFLYGAHLFLLQLWALSGGIIAYIFTKNRNIKNAELIGALFYLVLIAVNIYKFKPIYFPIWGELLSIEFTNMLISSFLVLVVYLLFKNFFNDKVALFAAFFVILATPVSFYAISLKHHSLSLLLTTLAFYFFYKYTEKNENKFIYFAYVLAGLCVWTRILDGIVLLLSLLVADLFIFRRSLKYLLPISIIVTISLMPFFIFNYSTLGNPFSIMETTPQSGKSAIMQPGQDVIILEESSVKPKQVELQKKVGYSKNIGLNPDWQNILLDTTFLKLQNTFGIFLVSPFLIIALAFAIDRVKRKIELNTMDKFFGLYSLLFIYFYLYYLLTIVTDTPQVIEYRYLLIIYITLLYFALRIDKVRYLIETKIKTIVVLYAVIFAIILIYFIENFPVHFMNTYYYTALITSISLIIMVLLSLLIDNKKPVTTLLDKLILFGIAASLALSSFFLLFYYWIVSMTYISPDQNHTILPVLENILNWMYKIIF